MPNAVNTEALHRFHQAYMTAALWSEVDSDGVPLDDGRDTDDITHATRDRMFSDCFTFLTRAAPIFEAMEADMWEQRQYPDGHFYDLWELAGHDFWLTRQGHGVGFWDRGDLWEGHGERLTEHAKAAGQVCLEVNDDGLIYQMGEK